MKIPDNHFRSSIHIYMVCNKSAMVAAIVASATTKRHEHTCVKYGNQSMYVMQQATSNKNVKVAKPKKICTKLILLIPNTKSTKSTLSTTTKTLMLPENTKSGPTTVDVVNKSIVATSNVRKKNQQKRTIDLLKLSPFSSYYL